MSPGHLADPFEGPDGSDTTPASYRRWVSLGMICLAVMVIVMDGSVVNVALPTLATELDGASNSGLQWIVDSYILAFAALLLTSGSAADQFGRRRVLLSGLVVFAAMSIGAAWASSNISLITWRALMGVGAAMMFPATLALIVESFPEPNLRRTAVACWAGSSGIGVAIGPVCGGWLLTHFRWGSIFLVNVPLIAVTLVGTLLFVRESRDPSPNRFDPLGNAMAISGVVLLVWALIEGPARGWASPYVGGGLALAVCLLGSFVLWESKAASPMLDVGLFRNLRFSAGCLAITAAFFGLFGFVFMVSQYFQFIQGYDALQAGVRTLPFAGFILVGAAGASRGGNRLRTTRVIASLGLVLMGAGFGWVSQDGADTAYRTLVAQMGFLGIGLGLVNTAATGAIMDSLPRGKEGIGSSVNDTTREIGGTLGVAGMGSLFNSIYRSEITLRLGDSPLPASAREAMRESMGVAATVIAKIDATTGRDAADAVMLQVTDSFLKGFHASVWLACGAACLGALFVFVLMPNDAAMFAGDVDL